jgi:hypothetical protein
MTMRGAVLALAVAVAVAACSHGPQLASCDDDLRGVYVADGERWMMLDRGATLEAYPMFPDGGPPGDLVIAPRVIDLERRGGALTGTLRRRYMRRAERCDAQLPVHVTSCAGETVTLVLADPAPPLGFSPCTWPGASPSRVVRWRRE